MPWQQLLRLWLDMKFPLLRNGVRPIKVLVHCVWITCVGLFFIRLATADTCSNIEAKVLAIAGTIISSLPWFLLFFVTAIISTLLEAGVCNLTWVFAVSGKELNPTKEGENDDVHCDNENDRREGEKTEGALDSPVTISEASLPLSLCCSDVQPAAYQNENNSEVEIRAEPEMHENGCREGGKMVEAAISSAVPVQPLESQEKDERSTQPTQALSNDERGGDAQPTQAHEKDEKVVYSQPAQAQEKDERDGESQPTQAQGNSERGRDEQPAQAQETDKRGGDKTATLVSDNISLAVPVPVMQQAANENKDCETGDGIDIDLPESSSAIQPAEEVPPAD